MATFLRKLWRRRPPATCRLDWANPLWAQVGGVFVDCGGIILDMTHRRQPIARPPYALLDTPAGPGQYFNNNGDLRFSVDPAFSHADAALAATTGELTVYGRYFHAATGGAYNSLLRANLTASPYSQWGAEADGAGTSVVGYARSTATARASAPAQALGFAAGSMHSIGLTSRAGDQVRTYVDATLARYGTAASHYFDPSAGYVQIGSGVRGSVYLVAFWHRVLSVDEMAELDENPWIGILPERQVSYFILGTGSATQDVSHVSSGGAAAGGGADAVREVILSAQGGAQSGGAATVEADNSSQDASAVGSGGGTSDGNAAAQAERSHTPGGGATAGGAAGVSTGNDAPAVHGSGLTVSPSAPMVLLILAGREVRVSVSAPLHPHRSSSARPANIVPVARPVHVMVSE